MVEVLTGKPLQVFSQRYNLKTMYNRNEVGMLWDRNCISTYYVVYLWEPRGPGWCWASRSAVDVCRRLIVVEVVVYSVEGERARVRWGGDRSPVPAWSKACVSRLSLGRIAGSNSAGVTDVYVPWECCVLALRVTRVGPIIRPEDSYRMWCVLSVIVQPGQWGVPGPLGTVTH